MSDFKKHHSTFDFLKLFGFLLGQKFNKIQLFECLTSLGCAEVGCCRTCISCIWPFLFTVKKVSCTRKQSGRLLVVLLGQGKAHRMMGERIPSLLTSCVLDSNQSPHESFIPRP